jgi:hypothetical protein
MPSPHVHLGNCRNLKRCSLWLSMLGIACILTAHPAGQRVPNSQGRNPFDGLTNVDPGIAARQLRALNVERQKSMVSDTDRLLQLAKELNTEVENSNPDQLTQGELRKLADIEKLARNVKQKMSVSFVGGPESQGPEMNTAPGMNPGPGMPLGPGTNTGPTVSPIR